MAGTTLDEALDQARARKALPAPRVRRLLREASGLTQADLAAAVGVDPASISRWESGIRHPRRAAHTRYAAVLERLAEEVNARPAGPAPPQHDPRVFTEAATAASATP